MNNDNVSLISLRRLYITVFLCGAVVMILELVGTRIVAPFLGSTIYVWTSLIGVILASLSAGYWYGGKRADQKPTSRELGRIILLAAALIAALAVIKYPVLILINYWIGDIRLASLVASIILFAPPTLLLGMVSPFAAKLSLSDLSHSGAAVGRLYAVSTFGSILGTFLGGFFLISWVGNTMLLVILGVVLVIASWNIAGHNFWRPCATAIMLMLILVPAILQIKAEEEKRGSYDLDTRYQRLRIVEHKLEAENRTARVLLTDAGAVQAMIYTDNPDELAAPYTRFYRLAHHFAPNAQSALMIGGGGFGIVRDFLKTFPGMTVDVVEIDPQVTQVARDHFGLKDDPRMNIIHEDGRTFLAKSTKQYDVIMVDAFGSAVIPPFQLTTLEATALMADRLKPDGVLLANEVNGITGPTGRFLRASYKTFRQNFSQVYLFPVEKPHAGDVLQNVMLLALKNKNPPDFHSSIAEFENMLSHLWQYPIDDDSQVITDELAPIDYLELETAKEQRHKMLVGS